MKKIITTIIIMLVVIVGGYIVYDQFLVEEEEELEEDNQAVINSEPLTFGWTLEGLAVTESGDFYDPDIVQMPDGTFRLYYEDAAKAEGIKSLNSEDGILWNREAGVRIEGANMLSAIVLPDDKIRIYFAPSSAQNGYFSAAESEDGLEFTLLDDFKYEKSGDLERGGIRRPSVILNSEGEYLMYYDGTDDKGDTRIFAATSSDGLTWTRQGVVIEGEELPDGKIAMSFSPEAYLESDGSIGLFFVGGNPVQALSNTGIYWAVSDDGLDFTTGDKPEISAYFYEGNEDEPAGVEDPTVIVSGEDIRLYYSVFTGDVPNQTGVGLFSALSE